MDDPQRPLGSGTPRVAALDALLREIDGLRLALETDLTLAAAAVEAGSPELAGQLVGGDQRDLADFERRALGHLHALEAADRPAPVLPLQRARRARRLSRLLPVAPLVAAAAAVVGLLGGLPGGSARSTDADMTSAAFSSWEELDRLTRANAPADDVAEAARSLNAHIAALLDAAQGDPAAARQALALLQGAQLALAADDDADQLQGVLAQSRALAARLVAVLPSTSATSGLPAPAGTLRRRLPTALPSVLPSVRLSAPPRSGPRAQPAPSPRSTVRPSTAPAPSPSRAPSPSPSPQQSYPTPPLLPEGTDGL